MRPGQFIQSTLDPILGEWDVFARSIGAGANMDELALRDHAGEILLATVADMKSAQTNDEQAEKSKGHRPLREGSAGLNSASELHAIGRLGSGFDLLEVVSEYRALRASVFRLWRASEPAVDVHDVDDITRFNESIDQLITKAVRSYTQRVDQARDMFLAILSHDLRNPLQSIAMSAEVIPHLPSTAEARVHTAQITTSVSVMARMIHDLLDYTRTRLGAGMPVYPRALDLDVLGRALFDEFHNAHPDRVIRYHSEGDLRGQWDADRVRQALSNLMGNAIQHGAANAPVVLTLRGGADEVSIDVHNGGPPISPGELPRIFDPLVRAASADHPKKNRPGSIGLGLYIAREVAKSHGGRIDVVSSATTGTTFTLRMPRHTAVKSAPPVMDEEQIEKM